MSVSCDTSDELPSWEISENVIDMNQRRLHGQNADDITRDLFGDSGRSSSPPVNAIKHRKSHNRAESAQKHFFPLWAEVVGGDRAVFSVSLRLFWGANFACECFLISYSKSRKHFRGPPITNRNRPQYFRSINPFAVRTYRIGWKRKVLVAEQTAQRPYPRNWLWNFWTP